MQIREATQDDIIGIVYVQATTWLTQYPSEEMDISEADIRTIDWQASIPGWHHMIKSPDYSVWVAEEEGLVYGFAVLTHDRSRAELYALYVLPEHQEQGIGSSLMDTLLQDLEEDLFLHVATYNQRAQEFYNRHGFVKTGAYGVYELPNKKTIPTLHMYRPASYEQVESVGTRRLVTRKELAKINDMRESTIKWYTELGLLPFEQSEKGRRRYYDSSLATLRLEYIKKLQDQGYSLDDIQKDIQ